MLSHGRSIMQSMLLCESGGKKLKSIVFFWSLLLKNIVYKCLLFAIENVIKIYKLRWMWMLVAISSASSVALTVQEWSRKPEMCNSSTVLHFFGNFWISGQIRLFFQRSQLQSRMTWRVVLNAVKPDFFLCYFSRESCFKGRKCRQNWHLTPISQRLSIAYLTEGFDFKKYKQWEKDSSFLTGLGSWYILELLPLWVLSLPEWVFSPLP